MAEVRRETLEDSLAKMSGLERAHLELGTVMLKAHDGDLYPMDLLATAALNRSFAHISGFRPLVVGRNLICAGAIARLQLDTAMCFYASFLVADPHKFALAILAGERVRHMRDAAGNRMTDQYLKNKLAEEYDWVPSVYDRTSGYIHFSAVHMMSAHRAGPNDDSSSVGTLFSKISATDHDLPEQIYIEAVEAFCAATEILLKYVEGWAFTKANPELLAQLHRERDGADA